MDNQPIQLYLKNGVTSTTQPIMCWTQHNIKYCAEKGCGNEIRRWDEQILCRALSVRIAMLNLAKKKHSLGWGDCDNVTPPTENLRPGLCHKCANFPAPR